MTKVKKEAKVVKPSTQKINKKPLKKKPLKNKSKEVKQKVAKALIKSKDEKDLTDEVHKQIETNYDKLNIDFDQIQRGIEALLQYNEKFESKDLFKGEKQVFAQITSIRIPKGANRNFRIKLRHPLTSIDKEICLIVPDLKRGRKVDHEETVEHYDNLLKSNDVTYIKRILPIRQLRVEYDQFELKRRLCGYYDCFLVDGRISGHVTHLLGKTFNNKRKLPVPVSLSSKNLNNTILKAMSKTELKIHSNGDTYIVEIGNTDMPVEHIVDNFKNIIDALIVNFPGSWGNIRALHVKTTRSLAIPIYYTLKDSNKIWAPKVKKEKLGEVVTDELSTRKHSVTVHPDGRVILNDPVSRKKIKANKELKRNAKTESILKRKNINKNKKNKKTKVKAAVNGKAKQSPKKVKLEKKSVSPKKIKVEKKSVSPKKNKVEKVKLEKKSVSPKKIKVEK